MPFSRPRAFRAGLVALTATVLASCAAPADDTAPAAGATTLHNCGTEVTVAEPPRRAVSLNQSTTEIMLSLGLADRMVGTATWTEPVDPPLAAANARVPKLAENTPSFESVLDTEPDIVLGAYQAMFTDERVADRERFTELGVPTYLSPSNCLPEEAPLPEPVQLADIHQEVQDIADLFGVPERGRALNEQLRGRVEAARQKVAGLDSRGDISVLFWFARTESPYVAGSTGSPAIMARELGVRNAYDDVTSMWPQVSWEDVLARDPDLLVLGDLTRDGEGDGLAAKERFLHEDPAVSRLAAVRDDHLLSMTGTELNISLRTVQGIERLADRLVELDRQR
ncbi:MULTISPECIES: ABC transporter substrate-binding protein [unclassified Saccharopolyspora]|uniref:ABC transporter substrate-binding protein n=1 Tax=unclassified Saccharopolyspora TaxID=2646250 RepID=UPI001CD8015D|nr:MULTISPECIES: ABC transporter substrate-binding protein [unclassified Saccharopolyspora]MCA1188185.1 ABC transporter substrate-binding protein [Saccharopolyspora sp. 6T]MCA1227919.1 ABC transporter substrate-binding protein [Saccharopolyspora sp. 6M]MCA1281204.1 ABC transporter substrate-binding protein [Saccharopolyspora sp. 7B]